MAEETVQEQAPVQCTETELHDAADKDSAIQCRLYGEHEQHEAVTPSGGILRWPDLEAPSAEESAAE